MNWEDVIKYIKKDYLEVEDVSEVLANDIGKDIDELLKKYAMTDSMNNELERLKERGFTRNITRTLVFYYAIQQYIEDKLIDLDVDF
jgi:hypothetical protein